MTVPSEGGVRPGGPLEHGRRGCGRSERTYVDSALNKAAKDGPLSFRSEGSSGINGDKSLPRGSTVGLPAVTGNRRGPVIQIPGWSMPHEAAACRGVAGGPVGGWNRTGKVLQPQLKDRRGDDGGQKRDGGRRH